MIETKQFYFNELRECTYVLSDQTKECIIIDPGMSSQREKERVQKYISENNLKPVKVVLTHGHFDHVMGCAWCTATYGVPTYIHKADRGMLSHAVQTCAMFGLKIEEPPTETLELVPGECVTFGESSLQIIGTPGHSYGCVCLYAPEENLCFTGDTLFAGSCGRTDLPEGDYEMMCRSLTKILVPTIKPECEIYAGHGLKTTMAEELAHNPYLRPQTWIGIDD